MSVKIPFVSRVKHPLRIQRILEMKNIQTLLRWEKRKRVLKITVLPEIVPSGKFQRSFGAEGFAISKKWIP